MVPIVLVVLAILDVIVEAHFYGNIFAVPVLETLLLFLILLSLLLTFSFPLLLRKIIPIAGC